MPETMESPNVPALLEQGQDFVERQAFHFSLVIILLLMVVTVANSLGRYLFDSPIGGTITLVESFLMMTLIWFAASTLEKEDGNIAVDIVSRRFGERIQSMIKIGYLSVVLIIFVIIFADGLSRTYTQTLARTTTSGAVQYPTYISRGLFTVGIGLLCARFITELITEVVSLKNAVLGGQG